MFIKKYKNAASMVGYGLIVGLISVVVISALENTGSNTDNLFGTAGNKLGQVASGESVGNGDAGNEETAPNIILVTSDMTSISGTPGDDIFVVMGVNDGSEGGFQKTYTAADISASNGGLDLSSVVSVSDINNRASSSLNGSATFTSSGGNDTLSVFGVADLTNITNSPFSEIFLNSIIKLDTANDLPANVIHGQKEMTITDLISGEIPAGILFEGTGTVEIPDGALDKINSIDIAQDATVVASQATLSNMIGISGDGTLQKKNGADDFSGLSLNGALKILGPQITPTKFDTADAGVFSLVDNGFTASGNAFGHGAMGKAEGPLVSLDGKYYWEADYSVTLGSATIYRDIVTGLYDSSGKSVFIYPGNTASNSAIYSAPYPTGAGTVVNGSTPYIDNGASLKFAFDSSTGSFWIGTVGGAWFSGDPETGASPLATGLTSSVGIFVRDGTSLMRGAWFYNTGQNAFKDDVPKGFSPGLGATAQN